MKDQTFSIRRYEHQIVVAGKVLPHTWPDKGAALAGLAVEQRRQQRSTANVRLRSPPHGEVQPRSSPAP